MRFDEKNIRLIRIAKYLSENNFYKEAYNITKIANEESESKDVGWVNSKIKEILDLFNSKKDIILSYLSNKKQASMAWQKNKRFEKNAFFEKIPFAAEVLSIYFYVLDSEENLAVRAIVAAYLLTLTGILSAESGGAIITGILNVIPGAGQVLGTAVGFLTGVAGGVTLAAAIPSLIILYELVVDDKHVEEAKRFLENPTNMDE